MTILCMCQKNLKMTACLLSLITSAHYLSRCTSPYHCYQIQYIVFTFHFLPFDRETAEKNLRKLDGEAFLGRFIDFCRAYCREGFEYENSEFFIGFDSWRLSRFNPSVASRSRAWADLLGG